ncbi:MAG: hypothetical protein K8I03_13070 [Ignavibacteria bacterium]|nr:hypothetical protein [Ignavibacteria bacterium]
MKSLRDKIKNRKVYSIFNKFKVDLNTFTKSLKLDDNFKMTVYNAMEESGGNTEVWSQHFYPGIGFFRGSLDSIVNQASWRLKQDLEFRNSPPISPKYQLMFRAHLISHLTGLLNKAVNSVGPLMREIELDREALNHELDVQEDFYNILYTNINQVDTVFTKVFNDYNKNIRPFRDSTKTTMAISISIIALILTILINFRNEIWNYIFKSSP